MKKIVRRSLYFVSSIILLGFMLFHFYSPRLIVEIDTNPQKSIVGENIENFRFYSYDSLQLAGRIYKTNNAKATVILIHGIRSNQNNYFYKAQELNSLGYNTVTLDLRAHGNSEGDYCTFGVKEKQDVSALLDYLATKYKIEKNVGVWGQSLGGAVAIQSTSFDNRISFCISESTFTSMKNVVREYMKRYVGFSNEMLLNYALYRSESIAKFDYSEASPLKAIKKIKDRPILIVHGKKDERINVSNAKELSNAVSTENVKMLLIEDATHTTVWQNAGETYFKKVYSFIENALKE